MTANATHPGRITVPGTDIAVGGTLVAEPQTENMLLSLDDRLALGPVKVETDPTGQLYSPGLVVPIVSGVLWLLRFEPYRHDVPPFVLGIYNLNTSGVDLKDLVSAVPIAVDETLALQIAAAAALGATNDTATASFVGNDASATTAALTTRLKKRTGNAISPFSFGAVEGTDSHAALQAFFDYVTANDVGTAYVGGNWVSSTPLTMGAALTKTFVGDCRITFTGTGGVGLTISGWNTGRWEALTLTGPSAGFTNYASKTWDVGLRLDASSRNTFGKIVGSNFNFAHIVANTGNVSGNNYGLVKSQDCGSGVLDTGGVRYGASTSWSSPVNSGSSGSLAQSCTVTVGTLPPAYLAASTYGVLGSDQAFLRITDNSGNKRLHLIRGINTGTSQLTLYPWVDPAITPTTADYVYGGALCISSGDSNVVEASMIDATRCGIGISMASLYGPHIQRAILQVCGTAVAMGAMGVSASTLGSRLDNLYFENNTEDIVWATVPVGSNVSAWIGAEYGLNPAKCYVAAAPKLATTFIDSNTYRTFGNTTLAYKGKLLPPEKRSMGGAYASATQTPEIIRPDQRLPLAGNTFTITPSLDADLHRLTGYDTLMIQIVGTGANGAPTGTITLPAPSGYTINGGAGPLTYSGASGVVTLIYRFDVVASNVVVTQTTGSGTAGLPSVAIAYKAANLTRNNATRSADPDLTLPVVASGVYVMEAWLAYEATTTADISVAFTAPAGATMAWGRDALTAAATASNSAQGRNRTAALGTPDVLGGVGAATGVHGNLYGTLFVSSTAGSLTLQWGQSTAEVSDAILYAGSWLRLTRVA